LRLLSEPERIESGWWDGADIARDYYTALDSHGVRLWVFRERHAPHGWFLHGDSRSAPPRPPRRPSPPCRASLPSNFTSARRFRIRIEPAQALNGYWAFLSDECSVAGVVRAHGRQSESLKR
jgi:hypothetical protein